ncbi:MAG: carbohydrate ABC transporter permease [Salana multivorans]|uniref:carbohydrate ABC transporter permease n=1 Tax=Salana multivorans TaxID=120377 RepID=UPI000963A98D|nr:carbohydrate ABC transporter permease [Salana multivorans]MBN8881808.1 carbohydrate ABC transporter permease [Salana multivorans]OJX97989.1 MAG: sugar ABC transporter permease [Micrococcales bacterium 73-15]
MTAATDATARAAAATVVVERDAATTTDHAPPTGHLRVDHPPRTRLGRAVLWVLLAGVSVVFLYPLVWLVSASLKTRGEVFDNSLLPSTVAWGNVARVWQELPLASWLFTSLAIATLAAVTVAVSSSLVAFGFAYFRFRGRGVLFGLVLATMMLPGAVTMVPVYLIWRELGLVGTWVPLFGANLFGSAFYIFLQRQFFLGLPRDLFEAARIDGASNLRLFTRIAMPLAIPSFVIVLLFEFQASWNNLQGALIYLNAGRPEDFTAPLGIAYAMTKYSPTAGGHGDYQYVMAASLFVTLPMLVLFALGQRAFIDGIATTGRTG